MELVYCDVGLYSLYKKGPQGVEKIDEGPDSRAMFKYIYIIIL